MRLLSLSRNPRTPVLYASETSVESTSIPGVTFVLHKMSAARRLDLISQLGELAAQLDMLRTSDKLEDRVRAEALRIRIDREYLLWGLRAIHGLEIDGVAAEAEALFERGPEALVAEIVRRIRDECELSPSEQKN